MSDDGTIAASVAADDTLRIWDTANGLPRPFIEELPAGSIDRIAFSGDNRWLGILGGSRVLVVDTQSGEITAEIALGEVHYDLAFGDDGTLYLGSSNGSLNRASVDGQGAWSVQRLWVGSAPIRHVKLSPRDRFLVIVDSDNHARQFQLDDGQMGEVSITLPSQVEDVSFSPNGSRVLFRTPRWVHRVGSSPTGLHWLQATFVPRALASSRIVFDPGAASGRRFYLPVAADGLVRLAALRFDASESQGLFGKRDDLLVDWRQRLGRYIESDEATPEEAVVEN